ncbi:MAG: hypothetical protein ACR2PH_13895, partial [Desulfobulbia bacterium]
MKTTALHMNSPFHEGEMEIQKRLGVSDIKDWARKVVRPYFPEEHRAFHTSLPFLVIAARDQSSRPWVTILEGPSDFITSPNPTSLNINSLPARGDALE